MTRIRRIYTDDSSFAASFNRQSPIANRKSLHSCRNAIIGSTCVARRAGTKQASERHHHQQQRDEANVAASVALTP